MVFESGCKHLSHYDTAMGALTVGVCATKVDAALDEAGGDIEIDYAIEVDCMLAGENTIRINVREPRPSSIP